MRVSTQVFYENSRSSMGSLQDKLMRVQQQLSEGTRVLKPSDDPLSATRALAVSQSLALSAQYAASRSQAVQTLSLEENALQGVTQVLQQAKGLLIQAGNGTLTDADRASIATTLESSRDQLQGLANSDDGNGQFLFAGFKSGSAPFVTQAGGAVAYVGDDGQRMMQVDVSRQIATADTGRDIFMSVGSSGTVTDVFAAMQDIITALRTPVDAAGTAGQAALTTALGAGNTLITRAHDNVLTVRASVGSRLQEIEALANTGDARVLQDKLQLSSLTDLDYGAAISEFHQRQTALQASQQTYVQLQKIALFNYL